MTQPHVLADRVIRGEGLAWDAARIAAANLLMIACAHVTIPLPWTPVPLTLQTFAVMFIAVMLGAKRSALVVALYLMEGAMGLPVFQPLGLPGAARLMWPSPTAGYLWSYPVAAFVTGWLVERWARTSVTRLYVALSAGQVITLSCGAAWLGLVSGLTLQAAFLAGFAPFVLGDMVKMALVVAATKSIETAGTRRSEPLA